MLSYGKDYLLKLVKEENITETAIMFSEYSGANELEEMGEQYSDNDINRVLYNPATDETYFSYYRGITNRGQYWHKVVRIENYKTDKVFKFDIEKITIVNYEDGSNLTVRMAQGHLYKIITTPSHINEGKYIAGMYMFGQVSKRNFLGYIEGDTNTEAIRGAVRFLRSDENIKVVEEK